MNITIIPDVSAANGTEKIIADWEKILVTTGLTVLSMFTLFGNILVVVSFYTYRPLRTLTNYFIVSLSMSDILVAVISMPVWITFVLLNMDFEIYGGKLLIAWTCFDIMFGIASIMNLTAVSVDRYIHITKPLTHQKLITKPRVISSIVLIWLFSCGVSLLKGLKWDWERPYYEMLIVTLGFILPFTVIVFSYVNIYSAVKQQLRKFTKQSNAKKQPSSLKSDLKAIKTIAIVILAFFVCWCPFFILNVIHGWCACVINQHVITFAKWLHYANSTINPIIYACFNKNYRRGFRNALYKHINSHSDGALTSIMKHTSFRDTYISTADASPTLIRKRSLTKKLQYTNGFVEKDSFIINDLNGNKFVSTSLSSDCIVHLQNV